MITKNENDSRTMSSLRLTVNKKRHKRTTSSKCCVFQNAFKWNVAINISGGGGGGIEMFLFDNSVSENVSVELTIKLQHKVISFVYLLHKTICRKYMINKSIQDLFHIISVIIPRPISALGSVPGCYPDWHGKGHVLIFM